MSQLTELKTLREQIMVDIAVGIPIKFPKWKEKEYEIKEEIWHQNK